MHIHAKGYKFWQFFVQQHNTAHDLLKAYSSTGSMIIFFGFDNSICHFIHVRAVPVNK